jgi:DUF177 domain-containing protein
VTTFNLRQVRLRSGEQYRDSVEVELTPLELGGQRYVPVPEEVPAELAITRAGSGTVYELAFHVRLHGPCYRCLGDAVLDLPLALREYQAADPAAPDELRTPYVDHDSLDLSAWARDGVALALPDKILCRPDCAGLCGECGLPLDDGHVHEDAEADPRWAELAKLRERL